MLKSVDCCLFNSMFVEIISNSMWQKINLQIGNEFQLMEVADSQNGLFDMAPFLLEKIVADPKFESVADGLLFASFICFGILTIFIKIKFWHHFGQKVQIYNCKFLFQK